MRFLAPDDPEWIWAWAKLRVEYGDSVQENQGEVWQYMGSSQYNHTFRHRCHPSINDRMYHHVPASDVWRNNGTT